MNCLRQLVILGKLLMNKRRRLLIGGMLTVCVVVALIGLAALPPRPGVTEANVQRVEIGMSEAEVEAIFGQPFAGTLLGDKVWDREDDNALVLVTFENGFATQKRWLPPRESLLDKICRCLHLSR